MRSPKSRFRPWVFALTLLLAINFSAAIPLVDSVSGAFSQGASVTITGSGFGAKNPALPRLWDDFEGHAVGTAIGSPIVGQYTRVGYTKYSDLECYNGERCANSHMDASLYGPGLVSNWIADYPEGVKNAFASMKVRFVGNILPSNVKLLRLNSHSPENDPTHGYPNYNIGKERGIPNYNGIVNHGLSTQIYFGTLGPLLNPNGWNSISLWDHVGDWDAANGWVGYTWGAQTQESTHDLVTLRTGGADNLGGIRSAFFAGYISYEGNVVDLYLDDVYADITLARIEIGDSPTYSLCTNREMQLPTAWSDNTVQITANLGAFEPSDQLYLFVFDENGVSNQQGHPISIGGGGLQPPVAEFSGTPTTGTAPLAVTFTDQSTNSPTSWSWDFGDSSTSAEQNPSHAYSSAGTYTVTLTATNSGGTDSETKTNYITVTSAIPQPPVAAFTGTPTSGTAPLTVSFTDSSTNSPASWSWSFGDGGTSTQQNPAHTYSSAGTYTVTMTATNAGGSDGETKTDYITVTPASPPTPGVPSISSVQGTFTNGASITISGSNFGVKSPVEPFKYDSFDYGISSLGQNIDPVQSGGAPWHLLSSCAAAGVETPEAKTRYSTDYERFSGDVTAWKHYGNNAQHSCFQGTNYLYLEKPDGFDEVYWSMWVLTETNGEYSKMRNVKIATWINEIGEGAGYPQGRWDFYPTNGPTNGHVFISGCSSTPFNGWGTGYSDFKFGQQTWNRYEGLLRTSDIGTANGRYAIWRDNTITADSGNVNIRETSACQKPDSVYFTHYLDDIDETYALPMPDANYYHSEIYVDVTRARIELCDASSKILEGIHCEIQIPHTTWNDNTILFTANLGSFSSSEQIYLFVLDSDGDASAGFPISLGGSPQQPPVAAFTGTPTSGTAPLTVSFTDSSTNSPASWSWSFGDGGTSTQQNPAHTYSSAGTYTVTLTATNAGGSDGETKTDYITVSAPVACAPDNSVQNCTTGGCDGTQTCMGGTWTACAKLDSCCGVNCDDANSCTTDSCSEGVCSHSNSCQPPSGGAYPTGGTMSTGGTTGSGGSGGSRGSGGNGSGGLTNPIAEQERCSTLGGVVCIGGQSCKDGLFVKTSDAGAFCCVGGDCSNETAPFIPIPPKISGIESVYSSYSSVVLTWDTDVPSSSEVYYGTESRSHPQSLAFDERVTRHVVQVSGLRPETAYYFVTFSCNENACTVSDEVTFATGSAPPGCDYDNPPCREGQFCSSNECVIFGVGSERGKLPGSVILISASVLALIALVAVFMLSAVLFLFLMKKKQPKVPPILGKDSGEAANLKEERNNTDDS